jgi:hypothetical protein
MFFASFQSWEPQYEPLAVSFDETNGGLGVAVINV